MKIVRPESKSKRISIRSLLHSNFTKKLYKPALIILGLQFLAIPVIINYNRDTIKYALGIESRYDLINVKKNFNFFFQDLKFYFQDLFNSFDKNNQLDRVDLIINLKNQSKLIKGKCFEEQILPMKCNEFSGNSWAKANLKINGKEHKSKIRSKGMRRLHKLSFKKMSFRVNLTGDSNYEGLDKFAIQMPVIRGYEKELLLSEIITDQGIISPRHKYIRFYINGEYLGVRHIEEVVGKEIIESSKRRLGPIVDLDSNYSDIFEDARFSIRNENLWKFTEKRLDKQAITILENLKITDKVDSSYFDIKKWGTFMGIMDLFQTMHGSEPSSVKFYLNPVTGLIEPIFWDGHYDRWHKRTRLVDLAYKYSNKETCKKGLKGTSHAVNLCPNITWYKKFFGDRDNANTNFYQRYLNTLEYFSSNKFIQNQLRAGWDHLSPIRGILYREFWRKDDFHRFGVPLYNSSYSRMINRLSEIREEVESARNNKPLFAFDSENPNSLGLLNQSSRLPQAITFECNGLKSNTIILIQNKLEVINFNNLGECNKDNTIYSLDNFKTNHQINIEYSSSLILQKEIERKQLVKSKSQKVSAVQAINKIRFKNENSKPIFFTTSKTINNSEIVFEPGTKVCIANDVTINFIDSKVIMQSDSASGGVSITGCSKLGGAFVMTNSDINIQKLSIKNLSSPSDSLKDLYGGINFINSNVYFDEITILSSKSEDGINFINSMANGNKIRSYNINSDAIDLDNSMLKLNYLSCRNIGNDCLDLSRSISYIIEVDSQSIGDKALSIGEKSIFRAKLLNIENSEIGITSKDESLVNIEKYNYKNVRVPLVAFIKKEEFSGPIIEIVKTAKSIIQTSLISFRSKVTVNSIELIGTSSSKDIQSKLYGNEYGRKTIRQ